MAPWINMTTGRDGSASGRTRLVTASPSTKRISADAGATDRIETPVLTWFRDSFDPHDSQDVGRLNLGSATGSCEHRDGVPGTHES